MIVSVHTDINAPIITRLISELADYTQRKLYPAAHDSIIATFKRIDSGELKFTPREAYLYLFLTQEVFRRGGYRSEHRRAAVRMASLRRSHPHITSEMREDVKQLAAFINRPTISKAFFKKLKQGWNRITP